MFAVFRRAKNIHVAILRFLSSPRNFYFSANAGAEFDGVNARGEARWQLGLQTIQQTQPASRFKRFGRNESWLFQRYEISVKRRPREHAKRCEVKRRARFNGEPHLRQRFAIGLRQREGIIAVTIFRLGDIPAQRRFVKYERFTLFICQKRAQRRLTQPTPKLLTCPRVVVIQTRRIGRAGMLIERHPKQRGFG